MSLPIINPQNAAARPALLSNDSIIPYKPTKPSVPTQPLYIPRNPSEPQTKASSLSVLRTTDNASFLATLIPSTVCRDVKATKYTTRLADCIIPVAALPLSRICNHKNIISLIDIVRNTHLEGSISSPNPTADLTIWEDMSAGSLAYVLPLPNTYPALDDELSWHTLAAQSFQRFGLPEGLVWHVLRSIGRALLWLHHGVKETPGVPGDWSAADPDWQAILICDVSPGQIWFKHPRGHETYGECKLGGFGRARVSGSVGARTAMAARDDGTPFVRRFFWAPEIHTNKHAWTRAAEIWALGATLYAMMTGIPPPRFYEYAWQVSRLNDRGYSAALRRVVAGMLEPFPGRRPGALELVTEADDGFAAWRAMTEEGAAFVDAEDEVLERSAMAGGGVGWGLG